MIRESHSGSSTSHSPDSGEPELLVQKEDARQRHELSTALQRSGRTPKLIYSLPHEQFRVTELIEYAIAAEKAGFESVWTSDHFQPWQSNEGHSGMAWMTLAAISQRTRKLGFGTGVTCPIYRYRPAIVAQAFATLATLAPGRVFLGLGTGEKLNEGAACGEWGRYEERSARLVEAVQIIRKLWSGESVDYKGEFWRVQGRLFDPPVAPIPIFIAASGPKSARIAGEYGDGIIADKEALRSDREFRRAWEDGVRKAGKKPDETPVIVETFHVIGNEKDAQYAAERWRFTPNAWKPGYFDNVSPDDIQSKAESEIPLDEVYKEWPIGEDSKIHIDAIKEIADLDVSHIVIHTATPDQMHVIDYFGKKILPRLEARESDKP